MSFKTRAAFYFLMSGMHYVTFVIGTDLKTLGFINLPTTEENITNESNMHFKKNLCVMSTLPAQNLQTGTNFRLTA